MTQDSDLSQRTSNSKKVVGRSFSLNGVHAIDLEMKKSSNLEDPIVDINLKLNNPIGRLWLALKRIWKSQSTIISLRFTIPLLVLPLVLYILWVVWQGRGMSIPMSKLGVIHQVIMAGNPRDILVLPTSDVYLLDYQGDFNRSTRIVEKPVIVIGTYYAPHNILKVESLTPYSQLDLPPTTIVPTASQSVWNTIWQFITQFH